MTDVEAPTSADELHTDLQALIRQAHSNGVDVQGGWECRNGTEYPDWDIVVTEVEKP
ncbi:hypothetical protein [Halovenus amylolytica]|uniref:hypothetical protein n=1 Tax=Halovenus amylolytica TaxID=2500550 RepID=UPI003D6B9F3C